MIIAVVVAGQCASATALSGPAAINSSSRPPFIAGQCAVQGVTGPVTDVNAQAGNGTITAGLNQAATITLFRYPNPSYFNQVKYYASGRDASGNPVGALPNEGSFAGILYLVGGVKRFAWLRTWTHTQRYASPDTPVVVTVFRQPVLGITVTDTDLATAAPPDAFVRNFAVTFDPSSPVTDASLVYYEKFDPIASKLRYAPGQDNCLNQLNDQQIARYDSQSQAIVHSWSGIDPSTGRLSSVAIAFGWDAPAGAFEVGRDGFDPLAPPIGPADAYNELDASNPSLGGSTFEAGQATGALTTRLQFGRSGTTNVRMIIAPGPVQRGALQVLQSERDKSFAAELSAVNADWTDWLAGAVLPVTDDPAVRDDALRALITMRLAIDPETGAIVASADTQAPYGEDWVRDGAFIDHALDVAGYHDAVTRHELFEADAQTAPMNPDVLRPPGNWPMMVYGDGQPSGPIPYEIDETGFGIWTLVDHARYLPATGSHAYLAQVYPAIARAAGWLSLCADPTNGLQCQANEDDSFTPSQTLHGAGPVLLGLRSAVAAASDLGDRSAQMAVWKNRAVVLQGAIDALYDPAHRAYREQPGNSSAQPVLYTDGGWLLWPVQLHPAADPRIQGEAQGVWQAMLSSLDSSSGGYEGKALLGVCETWGSATPKQHQALQGILHTIATGFTTNTGLFGEFWQRFAPGGPVVPLNDMPHVWESALFYLSSICIDGGRSN